MKEAPGAPKEAHGADSAEMRTALRVAPGALLVLLLALGIATSRVLTTGQAPLGLELSAAALVVALVSPAYLLLAVGLGVAGVRIHRGLGVGNAVLSALFVSSLVVVGVSFWMLNALLTSHSSTAALGLFAVSVVTLASGAVSFVVTWAVLRLVQRFPRAP